MIIRAGSIWWLVLPTLLYLLITRDLVDTLILSAVAAALWFCRTRNEIPPVARSYLLLVQPLLVAFFLGVNPLILIVLVAALAALVLRYSQIVAALEPWWALQQRIPLNGRRALAFVLPVIIGYLFGSSDGASGDEWSYTLLSVMLGTLVVVLLLFTPPASIRRLKSERPQ